MAAYHACEKIGMPECDTILAHLVVHLAETKKSVRTYKAYNKVKAVIRQEPNYPVPHHIRNAPTKLMKVKEREKEREKESKRCMLGDEYQADAYIRIWAMAQGTNTTRTMMSQWNRRISRMR